MFFRLFCFLIPKSTTTPTNKKPRYWAGLDAVLIFHFSPLEEPSFCIIEPKPAPNAIPNAIPSPTLSIIAPKIIPKTTPKATPDAILFSSNDFFISQSFYLMRLFVI